MNKKISIILCSYNEVNHIGECINLIGGNVNVNEIYMLDGSRRLIASLLSNKLDICIWLITINE